LASPLEVGAEDLDVVQQPARLIFLGEQAGQLQKAAPVMARLDDVRAEAEGVARVGLQQLDLGGVEAELVETPKPFLEAVALVMREELLVHQLAPEALVAREHLRRELVRIVLVDVEQLAVEVLLCELEVVAALSLRQLLVQLGGFGVDEVGGEPAGVAAKERVRQRAVAPEEPAQVE